jgi:glycosyltransferase involved in cell wall biosynthesis
MTAAAFGSAPDSPRRPRIAFFGYPDVFEDFYTHYSVDHHSFATRWADTGSHALVKLVQREIGDVVWNSFSLAPKLREARHEVVGCMVRFWRSPLLHRLLWRAFYMPRCAWRWSRLYPVYAPVASYLSIMSWRLVHALVRERPDAILLQDYATGRFDLLVLFAKLLGIPTIAVHTGSRPENYKGKLAKYWSIPNVTRLVVSSRDEYEMLATRYRVPREQLKLVLTPIDTAVFRPMDRDEAARALGLDPAKRYALFVGRFDDGVKRISAIIRAFGATAARHGDAELLIVGDGPPAERKTVEAAIAEWAPDRVRLLGWTSDKENLARIYNVAECLVLASAREGFPTVVGEAMACGVPVLGSRVGGVPELVVHGETGWLFAPGDDAALTALLGKVFDDPTAARALKPAARRMAEQHVSPEVIAAGYRECFAAVLPRHALAPA